MFNKFIKVFMLDGKSRELDLNTTEQLLIAAIAYKSENDKGVCVTSSSELSKLTNISKTRVDHLITKLKRQKVLEVESSRSKIPVVINGKELMVYRTIKINF